MFKGRIFSLILTLAGLATIGLAVSDAWIILSNPKWATTQGTVVDAKAHFSRKKYSNQDYILQVKHRYQVDGKTFESRRYAMGAASEFRGTKEMVEREIRSNYSKGTSVEVYYAPRQPKYAVLCPERSLSGVIAWGIGGVVILGLAAFSGFRK